MWRMLRCDFTAISPSDRAQVYAHTDLSNITTELWEFLILYTGRWHNNFTYLEVALFFRIIISFPSYLGCLAPGGRKSSYCSVKYKSLKWVVVASSVAFQINGKLIDRLALCFLSSGTASGWLSGKRVGLPCHLCP